MKIAAVGRALPPHYYDQDALIAALRQRWAHRSFNPARLERLHRNVLVGGRYLALPLEEYDQLTTWGKANDAWIRVAQEVGSAAVLDALSRGGLSTSDIDALIFVTVTGVATPSIDARLMNRLGLPSRVKRMPIFGLGCVAGAAGIARAADYVRAFPDQVAVLLSVELCSLTLQARGPLDPQPDRHRPVRRWRRRRAGGRGGARVRGTPDRGEPVGLLPGLRGVMGWNISEKGFGIVLSADVPKVVRDFLRRDVDAFLAEHGLTRTDISSWVCHPGGPKVLQAMAEALELPEGALDVTWKSLREVGNLSSTSVLMVLAETLENHRPEPGSWGLLLAMGPGFCSELVLLRW